MTNEIMLTRGVATWKFNTYLKHCLLAYFCFYFLGTVFKIMSELFVIFKL